MPKRRKAIMRTTLALSIVAITALAPRLASSDEVVSGVASLTPVGENSCLAVALSIPPGQTVSGIRWYNNDQNVTFPHVLIVESDDYYPPNLADASIVLENVSGGSLAWNNLTLPQPVTSQTGIVHVVFELPAYGERTGEGRNGGPGLGLVAPEDPNPAYISANATEWVMFRTDRSFAVTAIHGLGRTAVGAPGLSDLRSSRKTGWWDEVRVARGSRNATIEDARPVETTPPLLAVSPNPFNPRTMISLRLATSGPVTVQLYNVRGQLVRTLVDESLDAGQHSVIWTGEDDNGRSVASGVYFVRLESPDGVERRRIALVR